MLLIGTYLAAQLMSRYKKEFESAKNSEERELLLAFYAEVRWYPSKPTLLLYFVQGGASEPYVAFAKMNG